MKIPAPPNGSQRAGRRLWRAVVQDYELAEHELTLLREAVFVADTCDLLQGMVSQDGPMVDGRANPALVELRAERILLARLLVALRVPIGDAEDAGSEGRLQRRGLRGVYAVRDGAA